MKTDDPQGKHALFEHAPAPGRASDLAPGRRAVFSVATPHSGTVVVECSACGEHKRIPLGEAVARILRFTIWVPLLRNNRYIRCPSCEQRAWCRMGWLD